MKISLKVALSLLLFFICSQPKAALVTIELFESDVPIEVTGDTKVDLIADFNGTFNSINYLRFIFYFDGDLLDPLEAFEFGPFPQIDGGIGSFGFTNDIHVSLDSRINQLVSYHEELLLFLDGQQDFQFWMLTGSVSLSKVTLTVSGDFVEATSVAEPYSVVLLCLGFYGLLTSRRISQCS